MSVTRDLSAFVAHRGDGTASMEFAVEGVRCAGCLAKIERGLNGLEGMLQARLNFTSRRLAASWREGALTPERIVDTVEGLGFKAHPFDARRGEGEEERHTQWLLKCLAVAGFAAMNIMLLSVSVWSGHGEDITPETRDLFHGFSALIALPAVAYAGQPFFRSAWAAIRRRQLNMDVPISVGVVLALAMSVVETVTHAAHAYFDSAVMLLFFLLCGRYLDHAARRKTRAVAANLAALKAENAHRLDEAGGVVLVPAAALERGDRCLIQPGERVPADGTVVTGASEIDESLVTGETARRAVAAGETIYAGSLNFAGALTMSVTAAGTGTLVDEIERLVEGAAAVKSRTMRLADRVSRAYAPVVHVTAALTAVGWLLAGASLHDALVTAIAVLIITCPCALALAVPAVQVVASGALFRAGILLHAGDAIERLAGVDTIVFDKTGTLTLPEPALANLEALDPDLLAEAARLALSSRHPLAAVLARHAAERRPFDGAVEDTGQGVRATIDGLEARLGSPTFCGAADLVDGALAADRQASLMAFSRGGHRALFVVRQALRPDAAATVRALADLGLDLRILSGDRPEAVAPVAEALGIAEWQGACKPAEKIALIEALQRQGRRVLMVGDGLNDAPALAAATVSLSPISAAQISQAQSDAVFLGDELRPVLVAIEVARRAGSLMRQNLALAVLYNAVAVPVAIAGWVTPLIAAAAMSGSSILVTLNALRAQRAGTRSRLGTEPAAAAGPGPLPRLAETAS